MYKFIYLLTEYAASFNVFSGLLYMLQNHTCLITSVGFCHFFAKSITSLSYLTISNDRIIYLWLCS